MKPHTRLLGLMAVCLSSALPPALPSAMAADGNNAAAPMYGSQLMTDKERTEHRARVWAAQSEEERNRIRTEHHEEMKKRAKAQGLTLPDAPPDMPARAGMGAGAASMPGAGGPGMMRRGMGPHSGQGPCAAVTGSAASAPAMPPCGPRGQRRMLNR